MQNDACVRARPLLSASLIDQLELWTLPEDWIA
jgi:hypothetical protein